MSIFAFAFIKLIVTIIQIYTWIIIASALVSWVNPDPYNKIVQLLYKLSYPAYDLVRKIRIPTVFGGIDIAPVIILLSLQFISILLQRIMIAL